MGRHSQRAKVPDKVARVVGPVGADRGWPADAAFEHRHGRLAFGVAVGLGQLDVDYQTVPILAQYVAQLSEPRLLLFALAVELRLGIRGRGMRVATAAHALEVARLLDNGRIEFGFQPQGLEPILPRSRFFPARARIDRWLVSSDVVHQGQVLGRISARLLESGRIEFAFRLPDGERILPGSRFFLTDAQVNRWLRSSHIDLELP